MKKRIGSFLLALAMILGLASGLSTPAYAAGSDFVIENGVLVKYTGTAVDVVIPDGVKEIGSYAFFQNYFNVRLRSIVIPEGVTEIPDMCFNPCRALERVVLPQSLTSIGNWAFSDAESLKEINLPNGLKTIGYNAFDGCTSLTSVTIPNSVTEIGYGAFAGCTALADISIPSTVSIGGDAFRDTPWLENGGNSQGSSQKGLTIVGNTLVGNNYGLGDKVGHLTIPQGVRVIAGGTLSYLNMTSVTIPEGVEEIGSRAFEGCRQLTELHLPSTVKLVDYHAFSGCTGLTEATFPAGLEKVGNVAFDGCTNLKTVTFLGKDTEIENGAFPTNITIRGWRGSGAERYANYSFSTFEALDGNAGPEPVYQATESPVTADPSAKATESSNAGKQNYTAFHANPIKSYLYQRADGNFTRVEVPTDGPKAYQIVVEVYDRNFNLLTHKEIPGELNLWGGFFAGENYNFLIFGDYNSKDDREKEVIRVVKYSKDWERLDSWSGYGMNTNEIFQAATVRCAEKDGILVIHTGHSMYAKADGVHHQRNMSLSLRQSDMTAVTCAADSSFAMVGHSMNQFVLIDGNGVMATLDQGDANPRALVLNIHPDYRRTVDSAEFTFGHTEAASIELVKFPKLPNLHYNYTGAYVGGLELSGTHYLAAVNLHRAEFNSDQGIMSYAVDKQTRAVAKYQLAAGGNYSCPQMMKFSNDKILVLWEDRENKNNTIYYTFLDGTGKPMGKVMSAKGRLSDCKPILADGKAVWYTTGTLLDAPPTFYAMDGSGNLSSTATASSAPGRQPSAWAREQVDEAISLGLVPSMHQDYYTAPGYRSQFCSLADTLYSKVVSTPITPTAKFEDSSDPAVERMATVGVVEGVGNNRFDPFGDLTREQAATMLYRLAAAVGKPFPAAAVSFADKSAISSWASKEVGAVQAAGIMNGVGSNRFDPKGDYTLEQSIITMLRMYRYLNQ